MKKILRLVAILGILLLHPACQSNGSTEYQKRTQLPDGRQIEERLSMTTPQHPDRPGTLDIRPDGSVTVSTGSEPRESVAAKGLLKLPYIGAGLLLLGVLSLLLKAKLPLVPAELGIGCVAVGLLLIVLPSIIEAYLGYILLGLLAAAVGATIWRVNRLGGRSIVGNDTQPDTNK